MIDRLATFEDLSAMSFNEVVSGLLERGLSTSGGKRDLIDRFLAFEELNELTVCELKEKLSYRNLPCSGKEEIFIPCLILLSKYFRCKERSGVKIALSQRKGLPVYADGRICTSNIYFILPR